MPKNKKEASRSTLILLILSLLAAVGLYIYVNVVVGRPAPERDSGGICEVQSKCQREEKEKGDDQR